MTDFAAVRRTMVDGQVRTADVTDRRLLAAMLELPRERFFPEDKAPLAYHDLDTAVNEPGQPVRSLLKPMVLAKLIQAAEVAEGDRVLDVGCATGYSTALLAKLGGSVTGLEQDETLVRQARQALADCGLGQVQVAAGPLAGGYAAGGPYDVIVLEGSAEVVPPALFHQLKDGGRLACVLGSGPSAKATIFRMTGTDVSGRAIFDATAPALPGFAKPAEFVFSL
jgi:protein-L-isoaspartate(D-aspartate) O-methyltransferase